MLIFENLGFPCHSVRTSRQRNANAKVLKRDASDVVTYCSLITVGALIDADEALEDFGNMQKAGLETDVITYNSLITACANGGQTDEALEAFGNMQKSSLEPAARCYYLQLSDHHAQKEARFGRQKCKIRMRLLTIC